MVVFFWILGILLLIGSIAFAIWRGYVNYGLAYAAEGPELKRPHRRAMKLSILSGVIVAVFSMAFLLFVPGSLYTVSAGEVAVVKSFGAVTRVESPGLRYRNVFSEKVEKYSTLLQQLDYEKWAYVQDTKLSTASNTTQVIQVIASIQFNITDAGKVAVEYGTMDNLRNQFNSKVLGVLETAASGKELMDMVTGTGKQVYQAEVIQMINDIQSDYYVVVRQVIVEEFVLEEALETALLNVRLAEADRLKRQQELDKEVAEQAAQRRIELERAQNEIEVEKANALAAMERAKGEANAKIEVARGDAEKQKLIADALAYEIAEIAKAEALAIKEKMDALGEGSDTEKLAYLEYLAWVERWDGKLPETVLGDGVGIFFPKP